MYIKSVIQPLSGSTIAALRESVKQCDITRLDIAVAYITTSGFREFNGALREELADEWDKINKRWLTAFDYMRTEPAALQSIRELPRSLLRIHNSAVVRQAGCIPSIPFHPKVFIAIGRKAEGVLAGSGNMSRSGLRRGHEAGFAIGVSKPRGTGEVACRKALASYKSWFRALWDDGDTCDDELLKRYRDSHQSVPNLKNPTPTEDDVVPSNPNQLSGEDLRKLRVCEYFWIEAGNITKNLGPNRPGNQLMMKRLSRVFFGVPPVDVPQNSPLTHMKISFEGHEPWPCSLTFSDNGMDKLTLPAPATHGPPKYDNENLLFRRVRADQFALELGTSGQKRMWLKRSKAIGADFSMSSGGRIWGVF
jgi:HKD family nuclease